MAASLHCHHPTAFWLRGELGPSDTQLALNGVKQTRTRCSTFLAGKLGTGSGPIRDAAVSSCPVTYWRDAQCTCRASASGRARAYHCPKLRQHAGRICPGNCGGTGTASTHTGCEGLEQRICNRFRTSSSAGLLARPKKNRHLHDQTSSSPDLRAGCRAQNVTW